MTFEEFISRFEKRTKTSKGFIVKCPAHEDGTASLSVSRSQDGGVLLKCFANCQTESVCAALGLTMKDLFVEKEKAVAPIRQAPATIDKTYSYTDAIGRELYQVVRVIPKSFRQRHQRNGEWVWNMDGVERVLYRLPEVLKSEIVWIVEGEKDADNLSALGFCATCNVGGAGKWLDGYTELLTGKTVVLCGDNDDPGRKHMELVFESVSARAKCVKIIRVPTPYKDASDYIATKANAADIFNALLDSATPHMGGISMPVYSMADIEPRYAAQVSSTANVRLDLSKWLPSLKIRPLIPGELCLCIGDTGTGKTAILQNIALMSGLPTLLFEMELPAELMFERFFALRADVPCIEIEREYRTNAKFGEKSIMAQFPDLFICTEAKLTMEKIETIINRAELKMGKKPVLIILDYVQLVQGPGNRYEKTSNIAEGLKILCKSSNVILVIASQTARPEGDSREVGLHSAKDSGSLENSAGLVLGIWRDGEDQSLMNIRVLKGSKGGGGMLVQCNFKGDRMKITERSPIRDTDVPKPYRE